MALTLLLTGITALICAGVAAEPVESGASCRDNPDWKYDAGVAQLSEFSSHIVLDGFDVERFNRPDRSRLAHINLFGVLMRVFFDEPDSMYVRYFDRDASRYAEAYEHDGAAGGKIPYMVTSPESYEVLKERMRVALESGELQRIIDQHSESSIISNAPVNVKASLHFLGLSHHETKSAPGEKGPKGCDHVASEPDKRCVNRKSDEGVWAYEACPKTCGTCGTPCDRPGISTSRGAATFDCAYFRDSDGGNQPTMTVDNICKFLGGTRIPGAPNTQPKDSFRIPIYHGEQAYKSRPMEECETGKPEEGGKRSCTQVTRNGVTFWLNTYVGNVEIVDEEPVYEAYSDSQPFACTFP